MYIKKLQLVNFQVIERFDADFDGSVYLITGDNELGKSTLLKAIGALLTGKRDEVLRNGASKGFAEMVVGDDGEEYNVKLSYTEKNPRGTLTITQKSNGYKTDNVSMLQRIFDYQDFDAVEFSRWSETAEGRRKQIAVVKSLLPEAVRNRIDEIDAQTAQMKEDRTDVNREAKTLQTLANEACAQLSEGDVDKYGAAVDIALLMQRQQANAQLIEKAKTVRAAVEQRTQQIAAVPERIAAEKAKAVDAMKFYADKVEAARAALDAAIADQKSAEAEITKKYEANVAAIKAEMEDFQTRKANGEKWLADYEKNNPEKSNVPALLAEAEEHNRKHALVLQFQERAARYEQVKERAAKLEASIEAIAEERASLIAGASLPIAGLSFSEDGLTLNGIPFVPGKVSDSQTMEVAAQLIIAANPTVKVFRIARGESLGTKRLQAIVDVAKKHGFQGFIEQVQRGQDEMIVEEYTEA